MEVRIPSLELNNHDNSPNRTYNDYEGPKELDYSNPDI